MSDSNITSFDFIKLLNHKKKESQILTLFLWLRGGLALLPPQAARCSLNACLRRDVPRGSSTRGYSTPTPCYILLMPLPCNRVYHREKWLGSKSLHQLAISLMNPAKGLKRQIHRQRWYQRRVVGNLYKVRSNST